MKVSELIAELKKLDPDRIVILQKDPEGNGYSELASTYQGLWDDDFGDAWTDAKQMAGLDDAVVLVPAD